MNYYFWINGYENAGIVKAETIKDATQKVIMSQGKCQSIQSLDYNDFDQYDVTILIS
jgi:predicted nucleic acid-binding protein